MTHKHLTFMLTMFMCMAVCSMTLVSCGDEEPQWTPVEPEPVENQDNNPKQDEKEVAITGTTGEIGDSYAIIFGVVNLDAISVNYSSVEFGVQVSSTSSVSDGNCYKALSMSGSTFSVNVSPLKSKTKYWYRAYVHISSYPYYYFGKTLTFITQDKEEKEEETNKIDGHEYVDLGLPSGTLWATMNVGATKPEGYGSYFAWGKTRAKSNFTRSSYFDSSFQKYRRYVREILELEDDAAYSRWGNHWRIPTRQQWEELKSKCNWSWASLNGINGYKVWDKTWKKYIFLPAAGFYEESTLRRKDEVGCYWTSNLKNDDNLKAYYMGFGYDHVEIFYHYRWDGHSIRAVATAE